MDATTPGIAGDMYGCVCEEQVTLPAA